MQVAMKVVEQIENDANLKAAAIAALKAGALVDLRRQPIGAIVVASIAGWAKA
ncbi:MAG: hypothetical protein AAGG51_04485 [Cyanobacteria bacterium P01_G01_bin.54]